MKIGIQYQSEIEQELMKDCEFPYIEIPFEYRKLTDRTKSSVRMQLAKNDCVKGKKLSGLHLTSMADYNMQQWLEYIEEAVIYASQYDMDYIVLETNNIARFSDFSKFLLASKNVIKDCKLHILIENGYCKGQDNNCFYHGPFSDAKQLLKLINSLNMIYGQNCFGIALNVGIVKLLGQNIRAIIETLGDSMKLVYANDNDGKRDEKQLPYSFATGRSAVVTDWYRLIGSLTRSKYQGYMIFNTTGLFERLPQPVHRSMLSLLYAIAVKWEHIIDIESRLNQPQKKLILFGSGVMAGNFMEEWGDQYKPSYITDNNPTLWGTQKWGIEIISPDKLVEIPPEQRNVWICNQYYDQVGQQLARIGIEYECYEDHYFYYR